jgi:hypothetical protein
MGRTNRAQHQLITRRLCHAQDLALANENLAKAGNMANEQSEKHNTAMEELRKQLEATNTSRELAEGQLKIAKERLDADEERRTPPKPDVEQEPPQKKQRLERPQHRPSDPWRNACQVFHSALSLFQPYPSHPLSAYIATFVMRMLAFATRKNILRTSILTLKSIEILVRTNGTACLASVWA